MTPEMAAGIEITMAQIRTALDGHLTGRTFFTFLGSDADPSSAFSRAALQRLQHVKRAVDPTGVIRSNRPVLR